MDQRIRIVMDLMADDLHRDSSLYALAQAVNLSISRFHHLFKIETGATPARYLRSLRLELARELLETSFLTMKQLTQTVGFMDQSHFNHEFKRAYGLTPTGYRAMTRSQLNREHKNDSNSRNRQ